MKTNVPSFLSVVLVVLAQFPACADRARFLSAEVMGAYRFEDGRLVSVRKSAGKTLRVRFYETGKSRRLYPRGDLEFVTGPGFAVREPIEAVAEFESTAAGVVDRLVWRQDSRTQVARRVNRQEWVHFESDGAALSGRLDLPDPAVRPVRTAVVLIHGSGDDAATDYFYSGDFLAAHGIATLTYDKRGTGGSQGEYTFDFRRLAQDAIAAVDFLSSRPELQEARIGLVGYSQGAWIAPLAASLDARIRFVVASYGLVASPAEEARVETRNLVRSRGAREEDLREVDELTMASVAVVASNFENGWDDLRRVKRKYRRADWLAHLRGTTVGRFVRYPGWLIRWLGPRLAPKDLPWHYDSTDVLERLEVPMSWFLAENDTSAPLELALPMLTRLREEGRPIEVRVFEGADHAMLVLPDGYAPGYFPAELEAVKRLSSGGD